MSSQNNYNGQTIYMGIDVHKNTYSVVSICNNEIVKRDRIQASPEQLTKYANKIFKGAKINTAYEAGFSGFHLHRHLMKKGIKNRVVHPASIEVVARERVKTDRRDALKIGIQLSNGRLQGIHVPSEEQEADRMVTRLRSNLVIQRKRFGNQLKSLLFQYGLIEANDDRVISRSWIEEMKDKVGKGDYLTGFRYTVETYAEQWIAISNKIKEADKELNKQAERSNGLDEIYKSVPGIGSLSARILINELGDMKQFSNEKKLFSYLGLTPREYSSGEKRYLGSISRQGRPILRSVLVEAAWVAIRKDKRLRSSFEEIKKRAGAKRAIVAVARRLASHIRSCVTKGELYKVQKVQ